MTEQEVIVVETKPWYQSKTVIVNVIVALASVALYVLQGVNDGSVALPFTVSPEVIVLVIGVVNLILRFLTTQPLRK